MYYQSLCSNAAKKPEADALALALNIYVTNSSLAGTTATSYGFAVSTNGAGTAAINVGTSGAAFGLNNNASTTLSELLQRINARSRKGLIWDADSNGTLNSAETTLRSQAWSLIGWINSV